jgi:hypothetical protein
MDKRQTLKELFESRKEELVQELSGLAFPKDATLVQSSVQNYLNKLFDSDGEFRQNLTQSEDYILQAAMSLLNAQQAMACEFAEASKVIASNYSTNSKKTGKNNNNTHSVGLKKEMFPHAIGATAIGGAVGGLVLGTWGTLFGSIAGTALILYYASQKEQPQKKEAVSSKTTEAPAKKLDVERFTSIISSICGSVDSLIQTFRVQINRVVEKYENQEKPLLEKEYGVLLDSIQALLGIGYQEKDEKWQKKVCGRIEQLAESLENYGLDVVAYSDETKHYFDETVSENVNQATMVVPAIVKQGYAVRKGKVFINRPLA